MLSKNLKVLRYAGIFLSIAAMFSVLLFPYLKVGAASTDIKDLEKQMEEVKSRMDNNDHSREILNKYYRLNNAISNCTAFGQAVRPTIVAPFAPAATSLCINGALALSDPDFTRPASMSTGNGLGPAGTCTLSASTPNYDVYAFNVTGCAAFPTVVNISLCGPAGCAHAGSLDTELVLYRNVPAGDPLTANGGLPAVFNPASSCTNARAVNDDSNAAATSAGGATCDQVLTTSCPASCPTVNTSTLRRRLGSGRFTVVVSGFSSSTVGNYNLYVDAAGAGCNVALAPTAASASVSGRVVNTTGSGISRVDVTISGNGLAQPMTVRTNGFGYYSFSELPVGDSYVLTVASKQYTFNPASRAITLQENITDADFVSEQ